MHDARALLDVCAGPLCLAEIGGMLREGVNALRVLRAQPETAFR